MFHKEYVPTKPSQIRYVSYEAPEEEIVFGFDENDEDHNTLNNDSTSHWILTTNKWYGTRLQKGSIEIVLDSSFAMDR